MKKDSSPQDNVVATASAVAPVEIPSTALSDISGGNDNDDLSRLNTSIYPDGWTPNEHQLEVLKKWGVR
jgi:hypothetical protein